MGHYPFSLLVYEYQRKNKTQTNIFFMFTVFCTLCSHNKLQHDSCEFCFEFKLFFALKFTACFERENLKNLPFF